MVNFKTRKFLTALSRSYIIFTLIRPPPNLRNPVNPMLRRNPAHPENSGNFVNPGNQGNHRNPENPGNPGNPGNVCDKVPDESSASQPIETSTTVKNNVNHFYCKDCDMVCNTQKMMSQHFNGKRHQKMLGQKKMDKIENANTVNTENCEDAPKLGMIKLILL